MKVITILGTRPEFIRLSQILPKLDHACEHIIIHTGQNYSQKLNEIFFKELGLREPNYFLESKSKTPMEQIGKILFGCEKIFKKEKPDRVLILGDTNSSMAAITAKRMGIDVYHMEAGNRCFDDRVPEEVNRRIIDHSSDILMPYTERSRMNLLREGIPGERIYVTGNPIKEVLDFYKKKIDSSEILKDRNLEKKKYFLVTLHREENVDTKERLAGFVKALEQLHEIYKVPVIWSVHPRTRKRLEEHNHNVNEKGIHLLEPLGLFDFVNLEKNALCVLSDSGTVQEECSIFNIPNVTLRDVTERPETIEVGSNMISGGEPEVILRCVKTVLEQKSQWNPPPEYLVNNVSQTVVKIVLGFRLKYHSG